MGGGDEGWTQSPQIMLGSPLDSQKSPLSDTLCLCPVVIAFPGHMFCCYFIKELRSLMCLALCHPVLNLNMGRSAVSFSASHSSPSRISGFHVFIS